MPRKPEPYLRKQTNSWYCSIKGRQISLGRTKEAAFEKFHELMAKQDQVQDEISTLYALSQVYLDWCETNRKSGTYQNQRRYLASFIEAVGKRLRPSQLKRHHVRSWYESLNVTTTSQNDAASTVQRMLNWAVDQEYLTRNPVAGMRKPKRKRRDVFYTPDQWKAIRARANAAVGDLLDILFWTGCRPIEARSIEGKHLHEDLAIFPAEESKGETEPRVIFLIPEAKKLLESKLEQHPQGPLLRNTRGRAWTKDSIQCALTRISKAVGFRVIAYGVRHSYATNALTRGGVDPISVAHLMGHKDTAMVSRVYSHIAKNPEFLRCQAKKAAIGSESASDGNGERLNANS